MLTVSERGVFTDRPIAARRVQDHGGAHGVAVDPEALAAAEPHAKRHLDDSRTVQAANDRERGWLYVNLILERAGVALSAAMAAAAVLHVYHQASNLWEYMPYDVMPALRELESLGLQLVIVSNANGTVQALTERLGLTECVGCVLDSFVEKVEKPEPAIFEIALERSGARRETTGHLGDIYEIDVVGASAARGSPIRSRFFGVISEGIVCVHTRYPC